MAAKLTKDPELQAMQKIGDILGALPPDAARRVLGWVNDRHGSAPLPELLTAHPACRALPFSAGSDPQLGMGHEG